MKTITSILNKGLELRLNIHQSNSNRGFKNPKANKFE